VGGDVFMKNNIIAIRDELVEARFNLTSKENNIIDMILNIIKDDKKYIYEIDLEKYKKLFKDGSTNVYRDMKRATKNLFKKHNNFIIKNKATGEEFDFVWFSMLHYNDKEGSINFEIGDTLKKLLLDIKKRIYYDLRYTLNFRSIYAKRMYYMLKSFEDTGWRLDKIEDLKYKLKCPESYKNYAIFKQKVLDIAENEINGNSDITFSYEPIKTGRKVTSIKFTIVSNKAKNEIAATKVDTVAEAPKGLKDNKYIEKVKSIMYDHEITSLEAKKIYDSSKGNLDVIDGVQPTKPTKPTLRKIAP
jgi:plasmid replication initiation protein